MMKNRRKTVLCFLLVLCLTVALFPASASAAAVLPDPDVLVAVDPDSISAADAEKLVPAPEELVRRILGHTDVCPESLAIFNGEEGSATVVAAVVHYDTRTHLTAVTLLSDGSTKAVEGRAVVEKKGEFRFGGPSSADSSMRFGFVDEGNGKSRFYSTALLQKFHLVPGSMAKDQKLWIKDEGYEFDENGYCDVNSPVEIGKSLKQRYYRAGYYNGIDKKYPYDINNSVRTKHIFDFDRVVASRASTCAVPGELDYECVHCGAYYVVELPLLDHKWGDWTFNKDKTETLRVCKVCGAVEKKPA